MRSTLTPKKQEFLSSLCFQFSFAVWTLFAVVWPLAFVWDLGRPEPDGTRGVLRVAVPLVFASRFFVSLCCSTPGADPTNGPNAAWVSGRVTCRGVEVDRARR